MAQNLSRRAVFRGAGALAGTAAVGGASSTAAATTPIDFSDPVQCVRAFAKLAGSVEAATVHYWYKGTIYGMTPEESRPLLGYAGIIKIVWRPGDNGSYRYRFFDCGYYADLETGEPLDVFENPYTGEIVKPLHYLGGPFKFEKKPQILDWTSSGDDIWIAESLGLNLPNKLDPRQWPKGSTGETLNMRYVFGFSGKLSDLENDELTSAPCLLSSDDISPWYPYLRMGQRPGFNYWNHQGKKISDLSDISPQTLAFLEANQPEFLNSDEPWEGSKDSFTLYMEYMREQGQL